MLPDNRAPPCALRSGKRTGEGNRRNRRQGAIMGEPGGGQEVRRREAVCQENSDTPPEFQTFNISPFGEYSSAIALLLNENMFL